MPDVGPREKPCLWALFPGFCAPWDGWGTPLGAASQQCHVLGTVLV